MRLILLHEYSQISLEWCHLSSRKTWIPISKPVLQSLFCLTCAATYKWVAGFWGCWIEVVWDKWSCWLSHPPFLQEFCWCVASMCSRQWKSVLKRTLLRIFPLPLPSRMFKSVLSSFSQVEFKERGMLTLTTLKWSNLKAVGFIYTSCQMLVWVKM